MEVAEGQDHVDRAGRHIGFGERDDLHLSEGRGILRAFLLQARDGLGVRLRGDVFALFGEHRREDFGPPAAARPDFHDRHVFLEAKELQGLERAAESIARPIGLAALRAGDRRLEFCLGGGVHAVWTFGSGGAAGDEHQCEGCRRRAAQKHTHEILPESCRRGRNGVIGSAMMQAGKRNVLSLLHSVSVPAMVSRMSYPGACDVERSTQQ
jgi:hypothetical protein